MSLQRHNGRTRSFYTLGHAGCLLPTVCPCGKLKVGSEWQRPDKLPPLPHSHGMCPECQAEYRRNLEAMPARQGQKDSQ